MFDRLLESARDREKTGTPATIAASFVFHGAVGGALLLLSLLSHQVLQEPPLLTMVALPKAPEPSPPPPKSRLVETTPSLRVSEVRRGDFVIPPVIPESLVEKREVPLLADVLPLIETGGPPVARKVPRTLTSIDVPEPPPPVLQPDPPIRVGGNLQASKLLHRVDPAYPELARRARVSGPVVLQITVDASGHVDSVRVITGHTLLTDAAVDAVRQWQYSPTYLNGKAVAVIATVTVQFVLH